MSKHDYMLEHGMGSALLALAIPDTWFSLGERLAFAIVVSVITTLMSKCVSMALEAIRGKKPE